MSLNLSEADRAEYERRCALNNLMKELAIATGDTAKAKRARQANTALYHEFKQKQLPHVPTPWEIEAAMTLEERVDRLERLLKVGRYAL